MNKTEKVNKFLRDLDFTQNTFNEDKVTSRAAETRRDDDTVKDVRIGLYNTDYAIKSFIETVIEPYVEQDGEHIPVPVKYASPEKWSSIQRDGFMRDANGKLNIPIIMFNRTSMQRNELKFNKVLKGDENRILFQKKYTQHNRYDQWSVLTNSTPKKEYYSIDIPDYVDINYNLVIWCDYTAQVNHLTEQILYWSGTAWGETFKFMVNSDSANFEVSDNTGEDRIVKSTFDLILKGRLIPKDAGHKSSMKKTFSPSKIVWNNNTVTNISNLPVNNSTGSLS